MVRGSKGRQVTCGHGGLRFKITLHRLPQVCHYYVTFEAFTVGTTFLCSENAAMDVSAASTLKGAAMPFQLSSSTSMLLTIASTFLRHRILQGRNLNQQMSFDMMGTLAGQLPSVVNHKRRCCRPQEVQ